MVGTSILPQVSRRNQYTFANSPGRQAASRYKIIQCSLADGEQLSSIPPTQKQLLFGAHCRFLVGIWLRTRRQFHNEPFTFLVC